MFVCVLVAFLTLVRLQSGVGKDVVQDMTHKSRGRLNKGHPGYRFSVGNKVLYAHSAAPGEGDGTYRYLLGMNYWEQFSNALRSYFALACVADVWRARTVRPFTAHSRLYGLPNVYLDDHFNESAPAHDLSLILDLTSMDSVLIDAGLPPSASLAEMLKFGDRELIFLHFVSAVSNKEYAIKSKETFAHISDAFQTSSVVDCSMYPELVKLARLVTSNLNSQLGENDSAARFTTRAYVCIGTSRGFNPKELGKQFGFDEGNASVVVINWRGVGNGTALTHSSKGIHPSKRVIINDKKCLDRRNKGKVSNIRFSSSVLNAAGRFMTELGVRKGEFLVVHFRSEKLVFRESRFPRLLSNCVNEALHKKNEIVTVDSVGTQRLKVLYFADVGTFGSETCKQCSSVVRMERLAQKYNFLLTHFSPTKYNLPADRGFVAAVEMVVMSRAGHMILVGGGSFQSQLMQRFNWSSKWSSTLTLCSNDQQARETTLRFSPPDE